MKIFKTIILAFICLLFTSKLFADTKPKVLVLHAYHPSYKWTKDINIGINAVFDDITKVDLFIEYMDTKRHVNDNYIKNLTETYKHKYHDIKFDVIISSDDNAFNFLKKHSAEIFPNTPIVFCGVNNLSEDATKGFPNFTGVNESADFEENLALIFKLHPDVKNIYTVTDSTTTGKIIQKEISKLVEQFQNKNVKFKFLNDLTLNNLTKKIKNLPENSVVLFTFFVRTKDNKFLRYYEAIKIIEKNSKTPIYGLWDSALNYGIVGGYLISGYFQGETAAKMAEEILNGKTVKDIPIVLKSPNRYMFDYKQIKKFNIDVSKIPENAVFINKPDTLLDLYFKEIIGLIILFIMMTIFIIILLINSKKRKKAEKVAIKAEKVAKKAELLAKKQLAFQQNLIDNVNTPIYYKDRDKKYIGCNKAFLELFEVKKDNIIGKNVFQLNDINIAKVVDEKDTELLINKKWQEYECSITTQDGKRKDLVLDKDVFYDQGIVGGIVGTIFDMTKIKALNYDIERLLAVFDTNVIASKTDIFGNIMYASKAFIEISGFSENELLSNTHNILRTGLNNDSLYEDLWSTISNKKIWSGEIVNKSKSGQIYTLKTIITPEYDKDGNFLNYTSISHNITNQKLVEKANQEIELLNKDILETQKEVIYKLGAIAEARSKETGMHVKRVAKYSELFALYYGLSQEEADILKMASPMHDIGKIAIPDAILNKPAKFNNDEFEIMKSHAKLGYDMLKDSNKILLKTAAIVAHQHQEKYDGSGYPQGLKGEEIHIYGRITALADVFDALGSERVYKKAWNDEEIFELFKKESGKHFDPKLIQIFFENLDSFLKIRDTMKDIL